MLSFHYFSITRTVSNLEKSTAVSIVAYLLVGFFVFTTSFIVPTCIPLGYIPPNPDVSMLVSCTSTASVGIYVAFISLPLLFILPFVTKASLDVLIIQLTELAGSTIV